MKRVSITEFRNRVAALLSEVEDGEVVTVLRHGKAIAVVSPVGGDDAQRLSWRSSVPRLVVKGSSLSAEILEERDDADFS